MKKIKYLFLYTAIPGRKIQLNIHDNVIDEFYSMGVASKITGIPQPNIFKVCNGERNTAGSYKWRYKDDQD